MCSCSVTSTRMQHSMLLVARSESVNGSFCWDLRSFGMHSIQWVSVRRSWGDIWFASVPQVHHTALILSFGLSLFCGDSWAPMLGPMAFIPFQWIGFAKSRDIWLASIPHHDFNSVLRGWGDSMMRTALGLGSAHSLSFTHLPQPQSVVA